MGTRRERDYAALPAQRARGRVDLCTAQERARLHFLIFGSDALDESKIGCHRAAKVVRLDPAEAPLVVAAARAIAIHAAGGDVLAAYAVALDIASRVEAEGEAEQGVGLESEATQRAADEREFAARCEPAACALLRKLWIDAARRMRKYMVASAWPKHTAVRTLLHGRIALLQRLAKYDDRASIRDTLKKAGNRGAAAVTFVCSAADPSVIEELVRVRATFFMERRASIATFRALHANARAFATELCATAAPASNELAATAKLTMRAMLTPLAGELRALAECVLRRERSLRAAHDAQRDSITLSTPKTSAPHSQRAKRAEGGAPRGELKGDATAMPAVTACAPRVWYRTGHADQDLMFALRDIAGEFILFTELHLCESC